VFARLIDGEFPRYQAVIPTSTQNMVEADSERCTRSSSWCQRHQHRHARGEARAPEEPAHDPRPLGRHGRAKAHMDVQFDGKPCEIAFNPTT
jgi:DNA polymerase III sliding clamp (beta) subunit (PCNA family)